MELQSRSLGIVHRCNFMYFFGMKLDLVKGMSKQNSHMIPCIDGQALISYGPNEYALDRIDGSITNIASIEIIDRKRMEFVDEHSASSPHKMD